MAKREIEKDMIPVRSVEGHIIISKLFDMALAIFEKHHVNMPLNSRKGLEYGN